MHSPHSLPRSFRVPHTTITKPAAVHPTTTETMNGVIEALHIYDEHNSLVLSHTYTSRPLSATYLLPLYLDHPAPRPNLIYLPNTNPPTLVFSLTHASLLFLVTSSSEVEPLLVLELEGEEVGC